MLYSEGCILGVGALEAVKYYSAIDLAPELYDLCSPLCYLCNVGARPAPSPIYGPIESDRYWRLERVSLNRADRRPRICLRPLKCNLASTRQLARQDSLTQATLCDRLIATSQVPSWQLARQDSLAQAILRQLARQDSPAQAAFSLSLRFSRPTFG